MERKSFLWTALSGCVYALGPLIFLIVISNILGDDGAGVFSTSSMIALQLMTVGKYSVRNYQASDVKGEYRFSEYFSFRMVTCVIMLLASVVWSLVGGYRGEVLVTILCFTIYKIGEAVSDVFEGHLQQQLRQDLAGRCQLMMNLVLIGIFVLSMYLIKNLMIATIILAVASLLILVVLYLPIWKNYEKPRFCWNTKAFKGLLMACLALFLGAFFYSFMNNTPKYAISFLYSQEEGMAILGRFTQLFTPVFAVDLVAGFTMRTWLAPMANSLRKKDYKAVDRKILLQVLVVFAVTAIAMVGMFFLGGPILSWLYKTDLMNYRLENVLLMLSGGFVALQTLFENLLIIYRHQKRSIIFNIASAVAAAVIVPLCVYAWGFLGAVIGYLIACIIRALGYGVIAMLTRKEIQGE